MEKCEECGRYLPAIEKPTVADIEALGYADLPYNYKKEIVTVAGDMLSMLINKRNPGGIHSMESSLEWRNHRVLTALVEVANKFAQLNNKDPFYVWDEPVCNDPMACVTIEYKDAETRRGHLAVIVKQDGLRSFDVIDLGLCSSGVEMVMALTGKNKHDSQRILSDLLKPSTTSSKRSAAEALLSRRHVIKGFNTATPLITFHEGMQLVRLLPAKHVQHVINHVDAMFQQVTAGDPQIHFRVAENAASDATVNSIARDGLGMQSDAITAPPAVQPPEFAEGDMGSAYKRQRLMTDLLKDQANFMLQLSQDGLEDRDKMAFLDCMRNVAFGTQLQLTNLNPQTNPTTPLAETNIARESLTISDVAISLGVFHQIKNKLSAIGRLVATKYRQANNNQDPPRVKRFVDGQTRDVMAYTTQHRHYIKAGICKYMAKM
eukprot:2437744-Rhodomonas_salina.3